MGSAVLGRGAQVEGAFRPVCRLKVNATHEIIGGDLEPLVAGIGARHQPAGGEAHDFVQQRSDFVRLGRVVVRVGQDPNLADFFDLDAIVVGVRDGQSDDIVG